VIDTLFAGGEFRLYEDDLDLVKSYNILKGKAHGPTMTTLAMDELAVQNPRISFIHVHPGSVLTEAFDKVPGLIGFIARYIVRPLMWPLSTAAAVVGQRALYVATAPSFAASKENPGTFRTTLQSDICPESKFLEDLRKRDMAKTVWDHTLTVFTRSNAI